MSHNKIYNLIFKVKLNIEFLILFKFIQILS